VTHASSGPTPFGFGFDQHATLVVSEAFGGAANASAVSSYRVSGGDVALVSGSVHTGQTAACWIAVTRNGRYAYTTNAGSANIVGYAVGNDGAIAKLDGASATGAGPSEMAFTGNSRFLYALAGRANEIDAFAVAADGSLTRVGTTSVAAGMNGVVAR
jgi:6-phosphogluconolactonase (cycloisomerase 2 family)